MSEQIYIDTMKEQIANGMYEHLFKGRDDLVFLDIGANIGLVSLYAYEHCKRVVAIEPSPEIFDLLVAATAEFPMIECYNVALAPVDGRVAFYVNDLNFTASSTVNTYGERIEVDGWTFSHILDYHRLTHIDVCKIDAEGAEDQSLTFDQLTNAAQFIDKFYIEVHNTPTSQWETTIGNFVKMFSKLGYTKQMIDGMALTATRP